MNSSLKLVFGWQRALLLIPALLILFGTISGFCWFFAHSIALSAQQPDLVAEAVFLSPSDSLAHSQLGTFKIRSFVPTNMPGALSEFELAAALSPNDYRYWFALARMRERVGDAEGAERAAARSLKLAPNYAQVLWLNGNILLRRGQQTKALNQMRRAAEVDPQFAIHFVTAAAQTIPRDNETALEQTVGETASVRSALVTYLMQTKKFDQATSVWQDLPDKEKRETGKDLAKALFDQKKYHQALPFYELLANTEADKPIIGQFENGGFENDIATSGSNPFAWQIASGAGQQPQTALFASVKHGGERSLIVYFNSVSESDFRAVWQTVPVETSASYRFETYFKTEKLQSLSTVYWEATDAGGNRILAKTTTVPTGDNDWQKLTVDFKTSEATEAVAFRLTRTACLQTLCPITGKIWFDDFALQKIK